MASEGEGETAWWSATEGEREETEMEETRGRRISVHPYHHCKLMDVCNTTLLINLLITLFVV